MRGSSLASRAEYRESWREDAFAHLPVPLLAADESGLGLDSNEAFQSLTGLPPEDIKRKPVRDLFKTLGLFERLKNEGRLKNFPSVLIDSRGADIPVTVNASYMHGYGQCVFLLSIEDRTETDDLIAELKGVRDELGRRVAYLEDFRDGVFQMLKDLDSSERELDQICRELKDTKDQLIQTSKMTALGELAASLAHELNQPLTVIKGLSKNSLKSIPEDSPVYEKIKLIVDASTKMEQVIKHLRIFSRSEGPGLKPIDLNRVIKDSFLILREILSKHAVETVFDLGPLPKISGNPTRLEQVILNLASNAKDAMAEGGTLEITTRTIESGGLRFARMSFKDTGSGIPENIKDRIFDPFFTTKSVGKGTGLGLSISYSIIKEHNGDISVESEPGKGTTFHITIPALAES